MKRTFLTTLALLPLLVAAQTYYYVNSIGVVPAAPTTSDPITITLYGDLSASSSYIVSVNHTVVGNQVIITVNAGNTGIGLPVLVPHNEVFNMGLLPAGTYSIVINGANTTDFAPPLQHGFVVTGIGSLCDSVVVADVQWAPFSDTAIVVHVFNYSSQNFGYPGWILFDALGDTLAVETVNFFGIANESWHTLTVHPGAVIPTGSFACTLELWSDFYTTLWCTFNLTTDLCPPQACTDVYPQIFPTTTDTIVVMLPWAITDDGGGVVGFGLFHLDSLTLFDQDTVCLPPGEYTMSIASSIAPDSAFQFWVGAIAWNFTVPAAIFTQDLLPDLLPFTLYEQCIDSTNHVGAIDPTPTLTITHLYGTLQITTSDGRSLGRVILYDASGREAASIRSAGPTAGMNVGALPPGVYLLRAAGLRLSQRVLLAR